MEEDIEIEEDANNGSKEESIKNMDMIKNTKVPIQLRSKLNYFYTPYNPDFAFTKGTNQWRK